MGTPVIVTFSGLIVLNIDGGGEERPQTSKAIEVLIPDSSSECPGHRHYPRLAVPVEAITSSAPITPDAVHVDTEGRQFAEFSLQGKNLEIKVPGAPDLHHLTWTESSKAEEPAGQETALDWVLDLRRLGATALDRSGVTSTVMISPGNWASGDLASDSGSLVPESFEILDPNGERLGGRQALAEQFVWCGEATNTLSINVGGKKFGLELGAHEVLALSVSNLPPVGEIEGEAKREVEHAHLFSALSAEESLPHTVKAQAGGVTISTKWCPNGRWVGP